MKRNSFFAAVFCGMMIFGMVFCGCATKPDSVKVQVTEPVEVQGAKVEVNVYAKGYDRAAYKREDRVDGPVFDIDLESGMERSIPISTSRQLVRKGIFDRLSNEQKQEVHFYIDEEILLSTESVTSKPIVENGMVVIRNERNVEKIQISMETRAANIKPAALEIGKDKCVGVYFKISDNESSNDDSGNIVLYFRPGVYKDKYRDGYYLVDDRGNKIQNGGKIRYGGKLYIVSVLSGDGTNWPYLLYDLKTETNIKERLLTPKR